jgi:DNA segregation ATPase FtsK/SpoIIIE, S-DNA-T family
MRKIEKLGKFKMYFAKQNFKEDLANCFRFADIYKKVKMGKDRYKKHPTIHDVHIDVEKQIVRFVFTIPTGLDPDIVFNNEWVFNQMFCDTFTLKCDKNKKFTLTVYAKGFPEHQSFPFQMEDYVGTANKYQIPTVIGKDVKGNFVSFDMLKDPHLLVMGETGSGKSVYLRSLLTFMVLSMKEQVKLVLGDLKRTEFFIFRNLENVQSVSTSPEDLYIQLQKVDKELKKRGNLFDKFEVPHIDDYNAISEKKIPYIVVAIDEVAIIKGNKDIMAVIERISCIGRSLGIMLVLSMQRGDATVLDGMLKNNLTNRAVFRCADKTNSDIGLGKGSEQDASSILKSEKGKFYFKSERTQVMQAPLLEMDDARILLQPFKAKPLTEEIEAIEEVVEIEDIEEDDISDIPNFEGMKKK